ncbi:hypothetical protein II906_06590 [bacterium]|nr:hypothetical protein [bacterium]
MKKILVLLLMLFLSVPAFAVPGYKEAMEAIGGKPNFYDISEDQAYWDKLNKDFREKHKDGRISGMDYDKEVTVPYYDFTSELQKKGYPGFNN